MVTDVVTRIIYIDEDELFQESKNKSIQELSYIDIKDQVLVRRAEMIILKFKGEKKIIKSIF